MNSSTAATEAAAAQAPTNTTQNPRIVCGSFIQPWYAAGWSQSRWETELSQMKEAGMKYIILQSVATIDYDRSVDKGADHTQYSVSSRNCLYPSSLPELKGVTDVDSLGNCLRACKKLGMQAIVGTISDNRWWIYGWGLPVCPSGKTDMVNDSYMAAFVRDNADLSNRVAGEIWERYGAEYGDQIYCWYYNNEIWNMEEACKNRDSGIYAKILANSFNLSLEYYNKLTPGKPFLLSPFVNPSLSTAEECGRMWEEIFRCTSFRKGDIFCPQDSYGNNTTMNLDDWMAAYKKAVDTKPGLIFWVNNENFRKDGIARIDEFLDQVDLTAKYCAANVCFSWNHYYSPKVKNPGYSLSYNAYVSTGKRDAVAPSKPSVAVAGRKITVSSTDNLAICGVRIYRGSADSLYKTSICRDSGSQSFLSVTLDQGGTYYVSTYDFYNNESEKVKVTLS